MQSRERVIGIKDRIGIFAPQIVFNILASQRCTAADYWKLQLLPLQVLNDVLHFQRGFDQQPAQADSVGVVLLRGFNDRVTRLLDAEIDHPISIVGKNNVNQVLANVVDVALYRGNHYRALLRIASLLLHFRLKISDRLFHYARGVEHRRQLHLARTKKIADRLHTIKQIGIDELKG